MRAGNATFVGRDGYTDLLNNLLEGTWSKWLYSFLHVTGVNVCTVELAAAEISILLIQGEF